MTWRVADAEDRHLPAIVRIENESYPRPWSLRGFRHELRESPVAISLVAVSGPPEREVVGGYLFGWDLGEEIRVNNVAVAPTSRRLGLARMLLESVLARGRSSGSRRVSLEVRALNRAARRLYGSLAFVEVGRQPRHDAPEGDEAVLLERRLDP